MDTEENEGCQDTRVAKLPTRVGRVAGSWSLNWKRVDQGASAVGRKGYLRGTSEV